MFRRISISTIISDIVFTALFFLAFQVNRSMPMPRLEKQDIYYTFLEGQRLYNGANPYERILGNDMSYNKKYATYFPLFYELSALSQMLGAKTYDSWIEIWGRIFRLFNLAIAALLFSAFAVRKMEWAGVLAAGFWVFNRWTLKTVACNNMDFVPIFFMLASLILFPKRKYLSLVLFSVSLAFKQFAIFIAPLFLIWSYTSAPEPRTRWRQVLTDAAVVASVPFVVSLPFLFWNAGAMFQSIVFSATRVAETHFAAPSVDAFTGLNGILARLPMLILTLLVYWLAYCGIGKKFTLAFLIFAIFVNFNGVLYEGYMTWFFSLLPLLLADYFTSNVNPFKPKIYWRPL